MREDLITISIAVITTLAASSGFWTFIINKRTKNDATTRLLMGLAYDRMMYLGSGYILRGWMAQDEFHDYHTYLYEPYKELGGNGAADRMTNALRELPIRPIEEKRR